MPITVTDLAKAVGLNVADESKLTVDDFVNHVNTQYVLRDEAVKDETIISKITGKRMGELTTKLAQVFGLKKSEYDGKKVEEILPDIKTKYDTQLNEANENAKKGADERVIELTKTVGKLEGDLKTMTSYRDDLDKKYKDDAAKWESGLKEYKLNDKFKSVQQKITDKLSDEYKANDLVKAGFDAHISNTYSFELNDKDEVVVKYKKDGIQVKSKTTSGHPATLEEVLLNEAEAKGVLKKNNGGSFKPPVKKDTTGNNTEGVRNIHPNAQKRSLV